MGGLAAINAAQAYANLDLVRGFGSVPGADVTVGFVVSGIDQDHPLFTSDVIEEFLLMAEDETGATFSHGTAVASVVGADADALAPGAREFGFRGVARGASLKMFAIPGGRGGDGPYRPAPLEALAESDEALAYILGHALSADLDVLNLSFGISGTIDTYSEQELRAHFRETIATMAQSGAADKAILVWAAGNSHGSPCVAGTDKCIGGALIPPVDREVDATAVEVLAGLPARIEELRSHSVAVVAVGPDDDADGYPEITSVSNRCGIAVAWCIAAPGASVQAGYFGPVNGASGARGITAVDGTSFATPMVAGGMALKKQLFQNRLSNAALVDRLYRTANREGPFRERATYGQGLMDLGAATTPLGQPAVTMSRPVDGSGFGVRATGIRTGAAVGGGLVSSLAGQEPVAFEGLGAPFWFGLPAFAATDDEPTLLAHLHDLPSDRPTRRVADGSHVLARRHWNGAGNDRDLDERQWRFGVVDPRPESTGAT